jgi:anti-sigma factor RsiW
MDHAEAREQLLDLALEPARLHALETAPSPEWAELRVHLATCPNCKAELAAWRGTYAALDLALSSDPAAGAVSATSLMALAASAGDVVPPAGLRARTLGAAADTRAPSPVGAFKAPRRLPRWPAFLAMAAALVVFIGGAAIVVDRTGQLDRAQAEVTSLAGVTATLDRVLQDPGHHVAVLRTPAGTPAGSVAWSSSGVSVVVLTTALQNPPPGQVYRCWVQQAGAGVVLGEMQFSGSTAYWAGSVRSWVDSLSSGDRFWVSLEPVGGGSRGTLALEGTL